MTYHKLLKKVPKDKELKLIRGVTAQNYEELLTQLIKIKDEDFKKIIKKENKIIKWIKENYNDETLINELKNKKTKKEYMKKIYERIETIKKESQDLSTLINQRQKLIKKKTSIMPIIWLSIYIILIILLITQHTYYTKQTDYLKNRVIDEQEITKKFYEDNIRLREKETELRDEIQKLNETITEIEEQNTDLMQQIRALNLGRTQGPKPRITEENITIIDEGVIINVDNPLFAMFEDTKSMIPTINTDTKAIQIKPKNPEDIQKGDIISYETEEKIIIHRVIEVNQDEEGWYATTKGDNTRQPDREKVRFEQIRRILIALIY